MGSGLSKLNCVRRNEDPNNNRGTPREGRYGFASLDVMELQDMLNPILTSEPLEGERERLPAIEPAETEDAYAVINRVQLVEVHAAIGHKEQPPVSTSTPPAVSTGKQPTVSTRKSPTVMTREPSIEITREPPIERTNTPAIEYTNRPSPVSTKKRPTVSTRKSPTVMTREPSTKITREPPIERTRELPNTSGPPRPQKPPSAGMHCWGSS